MNAKLLRDPSEFNKPKCTFNPTGECLQSREEVNGSCKKNFSYCSNGWSCDYYCKEDLVYNAKANHCQDFLSCQKSMMSPGIDDL